MRASSVARYAIPVALGALVGSIAFASPASAATLPADDEMYSVEYVNNPNDLLMWRVSPGVPTTIAEVAGSPVPGPVEITDSAYDPTTKTAYVIGSGYTTPCSLWSVTTAPAALTYIADVTVDGTEPVAPTCSAFDILPDGTAYVVVDDSFLATINLATGIVTTVAELTSEDEPFVDISWIKYDAITDTSFAMDYDGVLFELNLTTGVLTFIAEFDLAGAGSYDADIDSAGTLWFQAWNQFVGLWSFDPANPAATLTSEGGEVEGWESDSLWIVPAAAVAVEPKPELAATGASDVAAIAVGSLTLFALGALLFLRRRATA